MIAVGYFSVEHRRSIWGNFPRARREAAWRPIECGSLHRYCSFAARPGADFDGRDDGFGFVAAGEADGNDAVLRADVVEDQVGGAVHAVLSYG